MAAPELTFSVSGKTISGVSGFDAITVTFTPDIACAAFECRATAEGEDWGVGKGVLVASFSTTPAGASRTFEIYDDYLVAGDGTYRISLFAQGVDGSWNDNGWFIPSSSGGLVTSDGKQFLSMR